MLRRPWTAVWLGRVNRRKAVDRCALQSNDWRSLENLYQSIRALRTLVGTAGIVANAKHQLNIIIRREAKLLARFVAES